ncbi:MAG: adenylyl-sulfate kinase [Myxococcota bacterium]
MNDDGAREALGRDDVRNVVAPTGGVSRLDRWNALGHRGATLWFTGLSGSGKSTVAAEVERALVLSGRPAFRLDGDIVRLGLNEDLGFTHEHRTENLRRLAHVARLFAESGTVAITAAISPLVAQRDAARNVHQRAGLPFLEIFVNTPIEVCEARDPKGLYKKARKGEIPEFTGISSPFEAPVRPELVLDTTVQSPKELAEIVIMRLNDHRS